jgi:hypothetical protein
MSMADLAHFSTDGSDSKKKTKPILLGFTIGTIVLVVVFILLLIFYKPSTTTASLSPNTIRTLEAVALAISTLVALALIGSLYLGSSKK